MSDKPTNIDKEQTGLNYWWNMFRLVKECFPKTEQIKTEEVVDRVKELLLLQEALKAMPSPYAQNGPMAFRQWKDKYKIGV